MSCNLSNKVTAVTRLHRRADRVGTRQHLRLPPMVADHVSPARRHSRESRTHPQEHCVLNLQGSSRRAAGRMTLKTRRRPVARAPAPPFGEAGARIVGGRPAGPQCHRRERPQSSGRPDSNRRPPEPHSGALPGCATSRGRTRYSKTVLWGTAQLRSSTFTISTDSNSIPPPIVASRLANDTMPPRRPHCRDVCRE